MFPIIINNHELFPVEKFPQTCNLSKIGKDLTYLICKNCGVLYFISNYKSYCIFSGANNHKYLEKYKCDEMIIKFIIE